MKKEFAPLSDGVQTFKDKYMAPKGGNKKGDAGRSKTFIQQAAAHEHRKRAAATKQAEKKSKVKGEGVEKKGFLSKITGR
jgi:hypothetical protein